VFILKILIDGGFSIPIARFLPECPVRDPQALIDFDRAGPSHVA
jgi:hypothetical protein